jgi:hypothetical protein
MASGRLQLGILSLLANSRLQHTQTHRVQALAPFQNPTAKHTPPPHLCEVWTKSVNGFQQVASEVPVTAGKQAAEAGHHTPDELITLQHSAAATGNSIGT